MPDLDETIGDALKAIALTGTFVYGALFVCYQTYYNVLGIHPEDVGVTHAFILVRSIGFILLAAGVAVPVAVVAWVARVRKDKVGLPEVAVFAFVSVLFYKYVRALLPIQTRSWQQAGIFGVLLVIGYMLGRNADLHKDKNAWYAGIALTAMLVVVLPAGSIAYRAHELGEQSKRGEPVKPYVIRHVPVLDVSSETVRATWICPPNERPSLFDQAEDKDSELKFVEGLSLGDNENDVYIRVDTKAVVGQTHPDQDFSIIKLPQKCVMLARKSSKDADWP